MNNNDLIRRGDVLARKEVITEVYREHGASFAVSHSVVTVDNINAVPAIEQPMSAVEYIHTFQRMCVNIQCCPHCPLYGLVCGKLGSTISDIDKAVAIVQKWAQEHPERSDEE